MKALNSLRRFLAEWRLLAAVLLVLLVGAATATLVSRNFASSQEGTGIVDFAKLTPLPFPGYPERVLTQSPSFADPTCQAPKGERPDPDLPELACRYSGAEPPPGAIATARPDQLPDAADLAKDVPPGWTPIDNRVFRYTLAIPPDWYSTMRPEGGEFRVLDSILVAKGAAKGLSGLQGGVAGQFSAYSLPADDIPGFTPLVVERLKTPNATFGDVPGAIWEDPPGENDAAIVRAAFAVQGVVYEFYFDVVDDGRAPEAVVADVAIVKEILGTVRPY